MFDTTVVPQVGMTVLQQLFYSVPISCYHFILSLQVQKLGKNEVLMVNIGSLSTGGRVSAVKADLAKIALTQPVCTEVGEKIALSRRVEKHWRWIISCHYFLTYTHSNTSHLSAPVHTSNFSNSNSCSK